MWLQSWCPALCGMSLLGHCSTYYKEAFLLVLITMFSSDLFSFLLSLFWGSQVEQFEGGASADSSLLHLHSDCSFKWRRKGEELLPICRALWWVAQETVSHVWMSSVISDSRKEMRSGYTARHVTWNNSHLCWKCFCLLVLFICSTIRGYVCGWISLQSNV